MWVCVQVEELVPEIEGEGRRAGQLERELHTSREEAETLRREKEDLEQNVSPHQQQQQQRERDCLFHSWRIG